MQRVKVVETAAEAQIHAALVAKCQHLLITTINTLPAVAFSLLAHRLRLRVAEFVGEMSPLSAQLEFAVPPRAIAGRHDAWLVSTWVLNRRSRFRVNFVQQLRNEIEEGELGVGDAFF